MIKSPASANLARTATHQDLRERTGSKSVALTVVAPRHFGILDLEYRFKAVFAFEREVILIVRQERVFTATDDLLAPLLGIGVALCGSLAQSVCLPIRRSHIEVHFHEHRLSGTFGSSACISRCVRALLEQSGFCLLQITQYLYEYRIHRSTRLAPFIRTIYNIQYQRNTGKHAHKAEIVIGTKEIRLCQQTLFHL